MQYKGLFLHLNPLGLDPNPSNKFQMYIMTCLKSQFPKLSVKSKNQRSYYYVLWQCTWVNKKYEYVSVHLVSQENSFIRWFFQYIFTIAIYFDITYRNRLSIIASGSSSIRFDQSIPNQIVSHKTYPHYFKHRDINNWMNICKDILKSKLVGYLPHMSKNLKWVYKLRINLSFIPKCITPFMGDIFNKYTLTLKELPIMNLLVWITYLSTWEIGSILESTWPYQGLL